MILLDVRLTTIMVLGFPYEMRPCLGKYDIRISTLLDLNCINCLSGLLYFGVAGRIFTERVTVESCKNMELS